MMSEPFEPVLLFSITQFYKYNLIKKEKKKKNNPFFFFNFIYFK